MKILRVIADLYPSVVGGGAVQAHEISKELAKRGHDVIVYTAKIDASSIQEFRDGYHVIRFKPIIKPVGNAIMPTIFFALLKNKNKFDLIHAHSHLYFSTNLCALVRRLGSAPLVITNHGLISQTAPGWLNKIYIPTIAKWTLNSADRVICYTETDKAQLKELGIPSNKIVVIHNGVDTNIFTPHIKENSGNVRLLWVGRFVPGKGVEYLLDAYNILVKKHPKLKLLMVGRGPQKESVEQKIHDLNLDMNVLIKDFVPNQDMPKMYQSSNVFVLPSLEEGVPRSLLEAMSCGIPVVCTKLPQLVDVVNDAGLLVPTKDTHALLDKISEVISDKKLAQRLGENGRKNAVKNYSWEDTVRKTIKLYENIIC